MRPLCLSITKKKVADDDTGDDAFIHSFTHLFNLKFATTLKTSTNCNFIHWIGLILDIGFGLDTSCCTTSTKEK